MALFTVTPVFKFKNFSLCAIITKQHNFKTILVEDDSLKYPQKYDTFDSYDNKGSRVTLMCTYYWLQAAHAVSLDCVRTFDTLYRCTVMQFNDRQSLWYKAVTPINAAPVLLTTVQSVQLWLLLFYSMYTHQRETSNLSDSDQTTKVCATLHTDLVKCVDVCVHVRTVTLDEGAVCVYVCVCVCVRERHRKRWLMGESDWYQSCNYQHKTGHSISAHTHTHTHTHTNRHKEPDTLARATRNQHFNSNLIREIKKDGERREREGKKRDGETESERTSRLMRMNSSGLLAQGGSSTSDTTVPSSITPRL